MKIKAKYCISICLILASMAFSLTIMELFLRSSTEYGIDRYLARGSNFWEARSGRYKPSKVLGYEPIPNSAPTINSYGMFDREYKLKKAKNTYRIVVLGDSITAYGGYTRFLEEKLNNNTSGRNFEVWNCGVGGYQIEQYVNYLKYKAVKYNPDMVMIGFCLNDFSRGIPVVYKAANIKNGLIEYYNPYSKADFLMNRFLFRRSYLYRFLMLALDKFLIKRSSSPHVDEQEYIGNLSLKTIKEILNKKNIPLNGVVFPYLKPLNEYTESERKEYGIITRVLKELKIDYIDLHPYFANMDLYQLRTVSNDQVHPAEAGHKIAAEIIYGYLQGNSLR